MAETPIEGIADRWGILRDKRGRWLPGQGKKAVSLRGKGNGRKAPAHWLALLGLKAAGGLEGLKTPNGLEIARAAVIEFHIGTIPRPTLQETGGRCPQCRQSLVTDFGEKMAPMKAEDGAWIHYACFAGYHYARWRRAIREVLDMRLPWWNGLPKDSD